MKSLKKYFTNLWCEATNQNVNNIFEMIDRDGKSYFLDCGCGNGKFTIEVAKKIGTKKIYGIDISKENSTQCKKNGINFLLKDLNKKFPFKNDFFDVIVSNQVIEHLYDIDNFVNELFRILKPGGYAIVSTENLSSTHNIFALLLGKQPFSQNVSNKFYVGNPFSIHYKKNIKSKFNAHMKVLAFEGLKGIFESYGFEIEKILGAGYYPFPSIISRKLSRIYPRYSAFITIKAKKPK